MKIYSGTDLFRKARNPVVTTGTFDGVHLGHQRIIQRLKEAAGNDGGETVLLTFYPHPRLVLFPDQPLRLLNTQEEKEMLLEKAGIDHLIVYPFTKEFSQLTSIEFIRNILVEKIGTKKLVIGYDHHFGRNREGSFEHLKEFGPVYGFSVEEIPAQDVDNVNVSSTRIRKALDSGNVATANGYLGYEYFLSGTVVKGKQLGRTLGYPTANIEVEDRNKLIPADGIYAVKIGYDNAILQGMLSIGMNPTVNGTSRTIEVNIFNFDKDIYGKTLMIFFHNRIREELKFDSLEALVEQIDNDKKVALRLLNP
jgi:riboflavin kinase / FMN adenylyltransferase